MINEQIRNFLKKDMEEVRIVMKMKGNLNLK
jgi:hypothetical protein